MLTFAPFRPLSLNLNLPFSRDDRLSAVFSRKTRAPLKENLGSPSPREREREEREEALDDVDGLPGVERTASG